jgi:hypothetical protein
MAVTLIRQNDQNLKIIVQQKLIKTLLKRRSQISAPKTKKASWSNPNQIWNLSQLSQ